MNKLKHGLKIALGLLRKSLRFLLSVIVVSLVLANLIIPINKHIKTELNKAKRYRLVFLTPMGPLIELGNNVELSGNTVCFSSLKSNQQICAVSQFYILNEMK